MANKKKQINQQFYDSLAEIFRNRLNELGITKYALCRDNNFNRRTCDVIINAYRSVNIDTLLEYLDAVGLELKVVEKQ